MKNFFLFILFFFLITLSRIYAQQGGQVDFKHTEAYIDIDPYTQKVSGKLKVTFVPKQKLNQVYLDAFNILELRSLDDDLKLSYTDKHIVFQGKFKANKTYSCSFYYEMKPNKALYFWGWNDDKSQITDLFPNLKQVWTQGQGKDTSNWLPTIDDMNDKLTFDLYVTFDKNYQVISNGDLIQKKDITPSKMQWHYVINKPMSSYLVALVIGEYRVEKTKSKSGVVLENYLPSSQEVYRSSTYKYHKLIFDFLEEQIGVPYPWGEVYRQVPLRDFFYAGMENTGASFFSDRFIVDESSFNEHNFCSVSAHELAHQWFGNLVTEEDSRHHWLHEGFATFYALKVEKQLFGEDYFWFKVYETAELLDAHNSQGKLVPLVSSKGSSLNYYQHGAWALLALENQIGEESFRRIVQSFLDHYAFKNVTTKHFLKVLEKYSDIDVNTYANTWLYSNNFPTKEAYEVLRTSDFMNSYLALASERRRPLFSKLEKFSKLMQGVYNPYLVREAIEQLLPYSNVPDVGNLFRKAIATRDTQLISPILTLGKAIPPALEPDLRELLAHNSYQLQYEVLYLLWNNFEEHKYTYLEMTKDQQGDNLSNVRLLWLLLALNTEGFSKEQYTSFYNELSAYTSLNAPVETRVKAFECLNLIKNFSDESLRNLVVATQHPNWRFNRFSTRLITEIISDSEIKKRLLRINGELPQKVKNILKEK